VAPTPTKSIERLVNFQEKAALRVVVADDVGEPEVEVEDKEDADADDGEVGAPMIVVIGTGEKDRVGCPDAKLQNCCLRVSIVDT
jgi:hypothetical protein